MKLIGRDIRFEIQIPGTNQVAGAYFNDVTYNVDAEVIDVATALSPTGEQRVDDASAKATISATGFVDAIAPGQPARPSHSLDLGGVGSDANFIDLATIGAIVSIRLSKLGRSKVNGSVLEGDGELHKYAPWQISKVSLKHGKRAASEDTMELVGTGGALPANYYPGMTIDE